MHDTCTVLQFHRGNYAKPVPEQSVTWIHRVPRLPELQTGTDGACLYLYRYTSPEVIITVDRCMDNGIIFRMTGIELLSLQCPTATVSVAQRGNVLHT